MTLAGYTGEVGSLGSSSIVDWARVAHMFGCSEARVDGAPPSAL